MVKRAVLTLVLGIAWHGMAWAVPELTGVRVCDVTPGSFAVVWQTDLAAEPELELYEDAAMSQRITEGVQVTAMPDLPAAVADAAKKKGIMKVRVSGLAANRTVYLRAVTRDPANSASVGYSPVQSATTTKEVRPYRVAADGSLPPLSNSMLAVRIYIRPNDLSEVPGLGDLVVLESPATAWPVSAFVGAGAVSPEGVLDLNNLFGKDLYSLEVKGGEKAQLRIYRGNTLATLYHYRRFPSNGDGVSVGMPVKGFFADINLDGSVDEQDLAEFRAYYRTGPQDTAYNPDFNFVEDPDGKVDVQDFVRFAREFGRTNVE